MYRPSQAIALILVELALVGCNDSAPTSLAFSDHADRLPSGPPLPAQMATVTTTLDFGDSPFPGRLRITPGEAGSDSRYAVDLDGDGLTDEAGPLGLGVALTYLYEIPGPHEMGIAVQPANDWYRSDRTLVVNDPALIRVADSTWYPDGLPGDFSSIALDETRGIVYAATDGLENREILAFRATDLEVLWRLSLKASAADPFLGDATALALSTDGALLYVDTGDSIEAFDVTAQPRPLGVVGPGGMGGSLVFGNDGMLLSGGSNGIARIDPGSGRILARRDALHGGGGAFFLSEDEERVAYLESAPLCRLSLLDARDLEPLWTVERVVSEPCLLVALSPRDDVLYLLAGRDGWLFVVFDAATRRVLRRMKLAEEDRRTRNPDVTSGAVLTEDGRYMAFSAERGAILIDTANHLPVAALRAVTDERAIGCCNVVSSFGGLYTAGWNLITRLSVSP